MPDFRVAETASEHAKMRAAGLPAVGLWSMAGSWAMNPAHLTDGWVPLHWVQGWPSGKKLAETLVKVGLWFPEERGGLPGYQFHEWLGTQRSASSIEDDRRKARDRMARVRSGSVRPNTTRTSDRTEGERSANVHDSLSLTQSPPGDLGRGGYQANAPAREPNRSPERSGKGSGERPAERCPRHVDAPTSDPCRACGDARQAALAFDGAQAIATAERRTSEARQRDNDRRHAIANCRLCDDAGYIGRQVCNHDPAAADRAARGRAAVQAALNGRAQEAS